jgi:sugar/nucleoside kinase (ribokinase family)
MSSKYDIVVAGQACLDMTPRFKDPTRPIAEIFRPGGGMRLNGIVFSGGGAVCNTGLGLHALGVKTLLYGLVGGDAFGRELRGLMEARGARTRFIERAGERTAYTLVIVQPGEDRIFLHDPGVDDAWTADDMDYALLKDARLFHFGYPTAMARMYQGGGKELTALFSRAKAAGALTSLDMSMPHHGAEKEDWTGILSRTLPHVDFFCPSAEEALGLLDPARFAALKAEAQAAGEPAVSRIAPKDVMDMAARFIGMGAGAALIKCSTAGLYLHASDGGAGLPGWPGARVWQPALWAGDTVSTSGAGDTAIAGFLGAAVRGLGPEAALSCAAMAGAHAVTAHISFERLPASVDALYEGARRAHALPAPGGLDAPGLRKAHGQWIFDNHRG